VHQRRPHGHLQLRRHLHGRRRQVKAHRRLRRTRLSSSCNGRTCLRDYKLPGLSSLTMLWYYNYSEGFLMGLTRVSTTCNGRTSYRGIQTHNVTLNLTMFQ
jgi:hypothetical protein